MLSVSNLFCLFCLQIMIPLEHIKITIWLQSYFNFKPEVFMSCDMSFHVMWHVIHMPVPCCLALSMLLTSKWVQIHLWLQKLHGDGTQEIDTQSVQSQCQALSIGFIKATLDTGCVLFCVIACIKIYCMIKGPMLNVNKRNRL